MSETQPRPIALLVGATGLVGTALLRQLAASPEIGRVRVVARRRPPQDWGPRVEWLEADFDRLDAHPEWFAADLVFCALGTTIRQAGSRQAFRHVDFDHVVTVARLARAQGARHFLVVSALGADPGSRVFYNRVKGEMEAELRALDFPRLTIARPSLLAGDRGEFRLGEHVGLMLGTLVPAAWKPVQAASVAAALIDSVARGEPGTAVLDNRALRAARPRG